MTVLAQGSIQWVVEVGMSFREDPSGNHYFALEIDGVEVAHFQECSGIKTETKLFELEEGGLNNRVHKLPGEAKFSNVTLRQSTNCSVGLWSWREQCRRGNHRKRVSGAVSMYSPDGSVVQRFDFTEVWPVRWSGPEMDGGASELAVEELEFGHDGLRVS